jgi:RHS repeat-associated protein
VIGGGEVRFSSTGDHTETVDRQGNETHFGYTVGAKDLSRLTSVQLPTLSSSDTIYRFFYHASIGSLDSIYVRDGAGAWGKISVHALPSSGIIVDSITGLDGTRTRFAQSGGAITAVYGPRGDTTAVTYAYDKVTNVTVRTIDVADLVLNYTAASTIGREISGGRKPKATDSVASVFDGPLAGSDDTTRFYTTGWGAVRGIRDALGNETWIEREDAAFPALPTRVRYPNGWEVTAAYNSVGLPDTIIDRSTGAVTTYQWSATWRSPSQVTSPEGVTTTLGFDGNGNVIARTVGADVDSVRYDTDGLVTATRDPIGNVTQFGYDARGNLEWEETPLGLRVEHSRDYLGRDTLTLTPDSVYSRTYYDEMGRVIRASRHNPIDAKWDSVTHEYTGGLLASTEAVGGTTSSPTDSTGASVWAYDGLGRVVRTITPVKADTMVYDLAGNILKTISIPAGDTVSMTYDVLGRLLTRRMSMKYYPYGTQHYGWYFPAFATSGLTLDTMTAVFSYDVMGNMLTANNAHSRITRTYAPNRSLETDQQAIRNYGSSSFTTHVYDLTHYYDRDGRRVAVGHPTWLSPGTDRTDYAYDPTNGRLATVTDALGDEYAFTYNDNGQPTVIEFPSGRDSLSFDDDGRVTSIRTHADGVSGGAQASTVVYDYAGRVAEDSGTNSATADYDGLGHVVQSEIDQMVGLPVEEYFIRDAFGNSTTEQNWSFVSGSPTVPGSKWLHDYPANKGGRLWYSEEEWDFQSYSEPTGWVKGEAERIYDNRGNLSSVFDNRYTWTYRDGGLGAEYAYADKVTNYRSFSKSYYGADGLLRFQQINRDSVDYTDPPNVNYGDSWGAYEEYWYDALGRRILKRSRQESPVCTDSCYDSIERHVWDGDQILWELRQSGSGDTQNPTGGGTTGQTGHVGYIHAGGVDEPLGMIRNNTAIILHRNWKGLYTFATDDAGNQTTCAPNSYAFCLQVSWPGVNWDVKFGYRAKRETETWYGSLAMGQQDRTGLMYRRNRYYDPNSGQFTQQDPIGIAGGLNLYGYANGDPINFSDPFGLFAEEGSIDCSLIEDNDAWADCKRRQYEAEDQQEAEAAARRENFSLGQCTAESGALSTFAVLDAGLAVSGARVVAAGARLTGATLAYGLEVSLGAARSTSATAARTLSAANQTVAATGAMGRGLVAGVPVSAGASAATGFSWSDLVPFTGHGERWNAVAENCAR